MVIKELRKLLLDMLKENENRHFETDLIISHALNLSKSKWLLKNEISDKIASECIELAKRRLRSEPLQYLINDWEFYGVPIKVGKGVLIPRQDTETLVEFALSKISDDGCEILDLCAGSGCISAAIANNKKNVHITAVEISDDAYKYAKKNLENFSDNVTLLKSDVLNYEFAKSFKDIDLIVCNPPYLSKNDMLNLQEELKYEPKKALYGGEDGLDFFRILPKIWKSSLKKCGWIAFEIGYGQKDAVSSFLEANAFSDIKAIDDLTGICRVVAGKSE